MLGAIRILDANINRCAEGIRVIEDLVRFQFCREDLTKKLRDIRHFLRKSYAHLDERFILARNADEDVGKEISKKSDLDKKINLKQICNANFKRITEALRTIEEYSKIIGEYNLSKEVEDRRYEAYMIEKEVLNLFKVEIPMGLYGITGEEFAKGRTNVECVKEMIKAGIKIIQYREKNKSLREKFIEAKEIAKLCKEAGVIFIVNDHIDIALLVDADGVHIGQEDLPLVEVRKLLGSNKLIGLSTHSIDDATRAMKEDIDYIGAGPIFPTRTKDRAPVGLEYLEWVIKNVHIPYVAIGGIKEHNLDEILFKGAKWVSLVSEVVGANDIEAIGKRLNEKILGGR